MRRRFLSIALLTLSLCAPGAFALTFYDNTSIDTFHTLVFSVGPYTGIGDEIELAFRDFAEFATLQWYNVGSSGTFDAELRLYDAGTAGFGQQLGGTFTMTNVASLGSDIIETTFALGGLEVPKNVIFVASVANMTGGMDLGLNLFEPPAVGFSDNTFLIVQSGNGNLERVPSSNENVYFKLTGVPEPSTMSLFGLAFVAAAILRMSYARVQ